MGKRRPVIEGAEEAQRSAIADRMLAQGKKDFESVYGSTQGGSFNLAEDMAAQRGVKMMTEEKLKQNLQAGQQTGVVFTPEAAPTELNAPELTEEALSNPPRATGALEDLWQAETNGEIPFNQWLASKQQGEEQLSEDPDKRAQQVAEFLASKFQNAPTADMLKEWRRLHGGAFLLHVADRVFIYRYLKRQEWIQLNSNPKAGELTEDQIETDIFNRCLLWPQYGQLQMAGMPAGAISMVVQQIRLQSLFLDPNYVAQLTIKI